MDIIEAIQRRHSVRSYLDTPLPDEVAKQLHEAVEAENRAGGLHLQLCVNEPQAFGSKIATYGTFQNVRNYIACVASDREGVEELIGYHGEKLVLLAQQLGLNTCWVGLTYSKAKCAASVLPGEKLFLVIALGYGAEHGKQHKMKPIEKLCAVDPSYEEIPGWFVTGLDAAQLAPTAVNQQKFKFTLLPDSVVRAETAPGPYAKIDLGIARCHFEIGADFLSTGWQWEKE